MSSFKSEWSTDWSIESRILNKMAIQILLTEKPSIKWSAKKIIIAFITSKKRPKVKIVIGNVKITKMGFTIRFNIDKTMATMIAVL